MEYLASYSFPRVGIYAGHGLQLNISNDQEAEFDAVTDKKALAMARLCRAYLTRDSECAVVLEKLVCSKDNDREVPISPER